MGAERPKHPRQVAQLCALHAQLLTTADWDFERLRSVAATEWMPLAFARIDKVRERDRSIRKLRREVRELRLHLKEAQSPTRMRLHVHVGGLLCPVAKEILPQPIRCWLQPSVRRLR